ncbi:ATP-binding protein [Halorubrum saccharovorum]|uniref:ATP-binding protein n=1 Tax=Halorubrum saccharovorum TaxID=2248 RepID=UPI0009B59CC8|nr:ATP-binding protein [Halorubrum saccharovorum]
MPTNEQHTNREAVDESKRVLTSVTDPGNQRVLEEWLTAHDQFTLVETSDIAEAAFDCCLLDREQLAEHRSELLKREENEQIILPYLLLVPESRHREIRNRLRDEHPELWDAIDGLIDMPLAESQLSEQLETFLRLRDQSIAAYNQRAQLRQIRNQHAGHGVLVTDTDGTIEYVNEGFESQSGYTSEEVVGNTPRILKSGEHDEAFYEELWNTITAGDVWDGTVINSRKDGDRYVIEQTIAPVEGPDGEITQFIAVNHEITELRELEESLRQQREQLDVLNRVLRHDIRNDMNVVVAWGEMLEDEVTSTGQEKLDRILRAGRHVVELTNVARDLSEIIHGDGTPDLKPIPLRQLLSEELEKRRETFANAEITMADPPDQRTHVLANELLSSVFRNLVNNAVQHNHTAQPKVMISVEESDESVRIRVADNGPGISDDVKESLFREGKKGLESGGTGMGLFLVDSLVESYGGNVWIEDRVESELFDTPDEADPAGTVFIVELRTTAKQDNIDGGRE